MSSNINCNCAAAGLTACPGYNLVLLAPVLWLAYVSAYLCYCCLLYHISVHQTVQIWFQEDFRNFWDACPWEEDLDYAKKVGENFTVLATVVP
jgi:hypothetical protein